MVVCSMCVVGSLALNNSGCLQTRSVDTAPGHTTAIQHNTVNTQLQSKYCVGASHTTTERRDGAATRLHQRTGATATHNSPTAGNARPTHVCAT